jgi:DNA-binding transcriptional regulator YiaG
MNVCPNCGSDKVHAKLLPKYHYRESGLDNFYLFGNWVTETSCANCGEKFISIKLEQQLLQVIALVLLTRHGLLAGKEIRYVREASGLTQDRLAKELGLRRRETVTEWELEATPKRDWGAELLLRAVLLRKFRAALDEEGNNHLAPFHIETLIEFEQVFSKYFQNFFAPKRQARLSVQNTEDRWQPEPICTEG